jgi:hypothetical protein
MKNTFGSCLQITDYSNPTLSIEAIEASAPARELVFELKCRRVCRFGCISAI